MSIILGQLCSVIIYQHFGENIKIIVNDLFAAYSKNLSMIIKSTKLSKFEVRFFNYFFSFYYFYLTFILGTSRIGCFAKVSINKS